jgi:hypothetical protein
LEVVDFGLKKPNFGSKNEQGVDPSVPSTNCSEKTAYERELVRIVELWDAKVEENSVLLRLLSLKTRCSVD